MVQDAKGRLLLLTNHTKNNVLIYNKDGKLLDAWGDAYPGAHGLTIKNEGGTDYLYITDTELNEVIKTTTSGRVVFRIPDPRRIDNDGNVRPFSPTETAIAENGDIYIADGYGSQYIYVFDQRGKLKFEFGGPGTGKAQFQNAHGIAIDERHAEPRLLITAREQQRLKVFGLDGSYQYDIHLPGAYICRPVVSGKEVYLATIWSGGTKQIDSGFVSILDQADKLISAPGGSAPTYTEGELQGLQQHLRLFKHPHDVCVDEDANLYIPQWNAGQVYPIKLHRV